MPGAVTQFASSPSAHPYEAVCNFWTERNRLYLQMYMYCTYIKSSIEIIRKVY